MLATVMDRDPRLTHRHELGPAARRETLDMARRSRYLALLRRWAQERLPAGTKAATEAAEWIRDTLLHASESMELPPDGGSFLVSLRARLLDESAASSPGDADGRPPSSRVEQLVGRDRLGAWEETLAQLPQRQRELVILRIEFGLDFAAIADETGIPPDAARSETVGALAALIGAMRQRQCGRAA